MLTLTAKEFRAIMNIIHKALKKAGKEKIIKAKLCQRFLNFLNSILNQ